jgi:hypothetical protein
MSRTQVFPRLVAVGLAALVLSACSSAVGGAPGPSAPVSPTGQPATPVTTPQPTAPAAPPSPSVAPTPSAEPVVVRIGTGTIARVTADGVAVRVRPGLDMPLVKGHDFGDGTEVEAVRLDAGDRVAVIWGPVLVDGHTWYGVGHVETAEPIVFTEGWMVADFLAEEGPMTRPLTVLTSDGLGTGQAVSGEVPDSFPLTVNVIAAPMPGDASCEAEVVLIGTDGEVVTVGESEITETTQFFGSPLENAALYQADAGKVTLQVRSDCSWAGMAWAPAG